VEYPQITDTACLKICIQFILVAFKIHFIMCSFSSAVLAHFWPAIGNGFYINVIIK